MSNFYPGKRTQQALQAAGDRHAAAAFALLERERRERQAREINEELAAFGLRLAADNNPGWYYALTDGRQVWVTEARS